MISSLDREKLAKIYNKINPNYKERESSESSQNLDEMYDKMMQSSYGTSYSSVVSSYAMSRVSEFGSRDFKDDRVATRDPIRVKTMKDVHKRSVKVMKKRRTSYAMYNNYSHKADMTRHKKKNSSFSDIESSRHEKQIESYEDIPKGNKNSNVMEEYYGQYVRENAKTDISSGIKADNSDSMIENIHTERKKIKYKRNVIRLKSSQGSDKSRTEPKTAIFNYTNDLLTQNTQALIDRYKQSNFQPSVDENGEFSYCNLNL